MKEQTYQRKQLDPDRLKFHNRAAIYYTLASVVLLCGLSLVFAPPSSDNTNNSNSIAHRWLEDGANDDDDSDDSAGQDYSSASCRYIYDIVPDAGADQCRFARTCNGGDGVWAPFVFCSHSASTYMLFLSISPVLILWMVTLFRLLGSTAEDYFSPSLEMFSTKLGLPPRFAGVSLLALGNGAADVSATMSAIENDPDTGYLFSLGALSGAAMVISGVVAALVVLVSGGVPCRGALVRDVLALLTTALVVWRQLANGVITSATTSLFLSMYGLFVCLVLVADIYHRAVVLPRMRAASDAAEVQRQLDQEGMIREQANLNAGAPVIGGLNPSPSLVSTPSALDRAMAALSNYDTPSDRFGPAGPPNPATVNSVRADSQSSGLGWGVESNQMDPYDDSPIVLHGQHGLLHHGPVRQHPQHNPDAGVNEGEGYTLVEDQVDSRVCIDRASMGFSASSWSGAWYDGKAEVIGHIFECYQNIVEDDETSRLEKFLMFCELPFTLLRKVCTMVVLFLFSNIEKVLFLNSSFISFHSDTSKASVPIPCEGYYNRGVIAASLALSPLWFAYYLYTGHEIVVFSMDHILFFMIAWGVALLVAALVLRFAPGGDGTMALSIATPIALYGFVIAATWIDFVADHLVALLDFMGIVLHIPGTIMGLTVLAWGTFDVVLHTWKNIICFIFLFSHLIVIVFSTSFISQ